MIWKKDLLTKEMQFIDGVNDNVFMKKQKVIEFLKTRKYKSLENIVIKKEKEEFVCFPI